MTRWTVEQRAAVATVTLRDGEGHRLTVALVERLVDTLALLSDQRAIRAVILTGDGDHFCAGWQHSVAGELGGDVATLRRLSGLFQQIAEQPLPLIAAVVGDALSAGLELALVCDIRLAATGARFGFPDATAGRLPYGGGASRLARLAGPAQATRLLLTGDPFDADEALRCGLVSAVVPPDRLLSAAERLATQIAAQGPIAVRYAKEAVSRGIEMPLDHALRFETDLTIILQSTADRAEGVRAFAEKRPPEFRGE